MIDFENPFLMSAIALVFVIAAATVVVKVGASLSRGYDFVYLSTGPYGQVGKCWRSGTIVHTFLFAFLTMRVFYIFFLSTGKIFPNVVFLQDFIINMRRC